MSTKPNIDKPNQGKYGGPNGSGSFRKNDNNRPSKPTFTGRCEGLKGYYYDCNDSKNADRFEKTTKEIAEYVNKVYQYGSHLRGAIVTGKAQLPTPIPPSDIDASAGPTAKEIWKQEISAYVKKKTLMEEHERSLFSLVLGQCTEALKTKLEALPNWNDLQLEMSGLQLILEVRQIMFQFESARYQPDALYDAIRRFILFHQTPDMSNQEFLQQYRGHVQVIEHCGGSLTQHPGYIDTVARTKYKSDYADLSDTRQEDVKKVAANAYLACVFIKKADRGRYGKLVQELQKNFAQGRNNMNYQSTEDTE